MNPYPVVQKLPGQAFNLINANQNEMTYNKTGNLLLSPGDYVIPVMTYCVKQSGQSPNGHTYSLSKLSGKRAIIIRELNLKATPRFSFEDIQIVSWSLQSGLAYKEMTKESQKIIDEVIPEFKPLLKESFLEVLGKKWNKISDKSRGLLPAFGESIDDVLIELGSLGQNIKEIREFKSRLDEVGHDYSSLSELIEVTSPKIRKVDAPWSKISNNIYARFETDGHFQEIGFIQIRILTAGHARSVSSTSNSKTSVDLTSLVANPHSESIQPLAFSPLYGLAGIVTMPALTRYPLAGVALLAAVLASQAIDWDAFFELHDLLKESEDNRVQKELERGMQTLRKEHDELEKPLKEAGIISGKSQKSSIKESKKVRQYIKPKGEGQLQKDFDKLPGIPSKSDVGMDIKTLPDGTKIIKRPIDSTLEVQAPKGDPRYPDVKIKVKVRYL